MANVVIVADMLVGFLEPGHNLYFEQSREITPAVRSLLEWETAAGSKVFYLCDNHDPDDLEFNTFPVHCVRGTDETHVVEELSEIAGDYIPKRRYSCFYDTGLSERLAELAPEKVIVCGVCTDICVLHTVSDARDRDYLVEVPVDCVATFDADAHSFALQHMESILGAKLVGGSAAA